jgi:hypothetical protein
LLLVKDAQGVESPEPGRANEIKSMNAEMTAKEAQIYRDVEFLTTITPA